MTASALTNNVPLLSSPFDSGGVNSVVPTPTQMANGWIPNIDLIAAEQQNYLHKTSTTMLWLAQQLGLALPFNPVAGASIVATPKGGIISLKDSVTGNTQFYVALTARPIGYTDPSLDPTNWGYLDFGSISKYITPYSNAGGTSDAITANYPNMIYPALQDGTNLRVDIATPNTTTTPTFQPTLNGNVQTARTIVKMINNSIVPLAIGDLQGVVELSYSPTALAYVLVNPPTTTTSIRLPEITATVAANAITIGATPQFMSFRSTTLASGVITTIYAAPAPLVVPAGATLGTISGIQSSLIVVEMNNAGTAELAVVNLAGGNDLSETGLITTTAISAAASAANVFYSTTARAGLAYRVVARLDSTQVTAGTWAAAMSLIQGAGGNALTSMNSLGYGQTWQNLTGSRLPSTTYYNTTGKPIEVSAQVQTSTNTVGTLTATVNGIQVALSAIAASVANYAGGVTFIVPPSASYSVASTYGSITTWAELR